MWIKTISKINNHGYGFYELMDQSVNHIILVHVICIPIVFYLFVLSVLFVIRLVINYGAIVNHVCLFNLILIYTYI